MKFKVGDRIIMKKPVNFGNGEYGIEGTIISKRFSSTEMYEIRFDSFSGYYDDKDSHIIKSSRFKLMTKLDKALK